MKQILLMCFVLSFNVKAASLQEEKAVQNISHVGNGICIEGALIAPTEHDGLLLAARQIPALLAIELCEHAPSAVVKEKVRGVLREYEKCMIMKDETCLERWKISSITLKVALARSRALVRVKGAANPETFSTFLPPYTIQSGGTSDGVLETERAFEIFKERDVHPIPQRRNLFPDGMLHMWGGLPEFLHPSYSDDNCNFFIEPTSRRELRRESERMALNRMEQERMTTASLSRGSDTDR